MRLDRLGVILAVVLLPSTVGLGGDASARRALRERDVRDRRPSIPALYAKACRSPAKRGQLDPPRGTLTPLAPGTGGKGRRARRRARRRAKRWLRGTKKLLRRYPLSPRLRLRVARAIQREPLALHRRALRLHLEALALYFAGCKLRAREQLAVLRGTALALWRRRRFRRALWIWRYARRRWPSSLWVRYRVARAVCRLRRGAPCLDAVRSVLSSGGQPAPRFMRSLPRVREQNVEHYRALARRDPALRRARRSRALRRLLAKAKSKR